MLLKTTIPIKVEFKSFCILDIRKDKRYKKHQDLFMYSDLIEYLQNKISALERLN